MDDREIQTEKAVILAKLESLYPQISALEKELTKIKRENELPAYKEKYLGKIFHFSDQDSSNKYNCYFIVKEALDLVWIEGHQLMIAKDASIVRLKESVMPSRHVQRQVSKEEMEQIIEVLTNNIKVLFTLDQ